VAEVEAERAQV